MRQIHSQNSKLGVGGALVGIRIVLGTAMSRSPKSEWHVGQRQINEVEKCIRENTAIRTKFRGGVRVQACHADV